MKKTFQELRLFLTTIMLGAILAVILGNFGFLNADPKIIGLHRIRKAPEIDDVKVFITVILPYLVVLAFRLVHSIKNQLNNQNKE
ncbi:MAG: hypothetical protein KKC21_05295 [Nitrospinae bacterium]|nr:hypothetical protein [Nitrospinota bacterium]